MLLLLVEVVLLCFVVVFGQSNFEVPDAKVEVFHPRGLRVSIPGKLWLCLTTYLFIKI